MPTPDHTGPYRPPVRKKKRVDEAVQPTIASLVKAKKITKVQAVRVTHLIRQIAALIVLHNRRLRDACETNRRLDMTLRFSVCPDYLQLRCVHTGIHHAVNIRLPNVSPFETLIPNATRQVKTSTPEFKEAVKDVIRSIEISFWVDHLGSWVEFIDRYPQRYPQLFGLLTYTYGLLDAFDAMEASGGR